MGKFTNLRSRASDRMLGWAGLSYEKVAPKVIRCYRNVAKMAKNKDIDFYTEQIEKAVKTKDKELYDLNVNLLKIRLKDLGLWKKAGRREINKLRRKMRI